MMKLKSREEIDRDMNQFVDEIMLATSNGSYEEVNKLDETIRKYCDENDVPIELNHVYQSGAGEMLHMTLTALERIERQSKQ